MEIISKKLGTAILTAGLVLVLSLGVILPRDVHARVERDIEITEGDPGDGFESGGGGGGATLPPSEDIEQYKPGTGIYLFLPSSHHLIFFNQSHAVFNLVPFFDDQKLIWNITFSEVRVQGGRN